MFIKILATQNSKTDDKRQETKKKSWKKVVIISDN